MAIKNTFTWEILTGQIKADIPILRIFHVVNTIAKIAGFSSRKK